MATLLPSLLFLAPSLATAQAIRGVVVDDLSQTPVPGAMVRLVQDGETGRGMETDSRGRFLFLLPQAGDYRLEVSRLGYEKTLSQAISVVQGDTVVVEFRVSPDAILVDPITVTGRSLRGRRYFELRQENWDRGFFFTPAMIDSIAPDHPAQVLKGLPYVDVRWGWGVASPSGGLGPVPNVTSYLGRGCVLYMVDFVPVTPPPWLRGDWASPQLASLKGKDIVAAEVYRSVLEVPPELRQYTDRFRPTMNASVGVSYEDKMHCGLVVYWTRAGW